MQKRAAEFFAGIGLMRMGLDSEGWNTVWANDLYENSTYTKGEAVSIMADAGKPQKL